MAKQADRAPKRRTSTGMKAMVVKEFTQMRRDKRTLALMVAMPIMMLIIFGYAARFDVSRIDTVAVGPGAQQAADQAPPIVHVTSVRPDADRDDAVNDLRNNKATAALITDADSPELLLDGSELFSTQSALAHVPPGVTPTVLFNPDLSTSAVMVPSLIGMILLFVGTVVTSLGVVREREQGTLEQLAVMPLRPLDVMVGKIAPYFAVAAFDMVMITVAGVWLFDVPFNGSLPMLIVFGVVYLFVVLGLGVAISTVSTTQGEAIQLAIMVLLPQIMLSGMIFPLNSMAAGVRWIGYLMPLTYFVSAMRDIFLRGSDVTALLPDLAVLSMMAVVVFGVAMIRFRRELGTTTRRGTLKPDGAAAPATGGTR